MEHMRVADTEMQDVLTGWLAQAGTPPERGVPPAETAGLRFAFYGRISTAEYQDRRSSRQWQRECAVDLTAGHGRIVAESFDAGVSRRREWSERPRAAALLAAVAEP